MHYVKKHQIFEFSASIEETDTITKVVNEFYATYGGVINLVSREIRSNRVERNAKDRFLVQIRLEYELSHQANSERFCMFTCLYRDVDQRLMEICNTFITQRKVVVEIKYRLFIDNQNDREVGAVVAVFYSQLASKAAS